MTKSQMVDAMLSAPNSNRTDAPVDERGSASPDLAPPVTTLARINWDHPMCWRCGHDTSPPGLIGTPLGFACAGPECEQLGRLPSEQAPVEPSSPADSIEHALQQPKDKPWSISDCPSCREFMGHGHVCPAPSPLEAAFGAAVERAKSWPFDPNPPAKAKAIDDWVFCGTCSKPQPATGHECDLGPFNRDRMEATLQGALLLMAEDRAEFAESLLCAMAFDHAQWRRICSSEFCAGTRCAFCDSARQLPEPRPTAVP